MLSILLLAADLSLPYLFAVIYLESRSYPAVTLTSVRCKLVKLCLLFCHWSLLNKHWFSRQVSTNMSMYLSHRFPTMGRVIVVFPQFLFNLDWLREIGNDYCAVAESLFWQCTALSGGLWGLSGALPSYFTVRRDCQICESQLCEQLN